MGQIPVLFYLCKCLKFNACKSFLYWDFLYDIKIDQLHLLHVDIILIILIYNSKNDC
ncbi:MAG: hypothetical protein PARBA_00454 [Parabacteroides sp.]